MIEVYENTDPKQRCEQLYSEFKDKVTSYVRGKVTNEQDVQDIVSEVFVKVFEGLSGYDESKASFSTWIYTITRNTVADHFRSAKRFCELPEEICSDGGIEQELINEETLERLANALLKLGERERDIVVLRYYSGKTLVDIAKMLGISYSYAKLLHSSALKTLRSLLE